MTAALSIASTGLQAAQLRLNASAHNVANLHTPGFKAHTVQLQAVAPSAGVQAHAAQAAAQRLTGCMDELTLVLVRRQLVCSAKDAVLGPWACEAKTSKDTPSCSWVTRRPQHTRSAASYHKTWLLTRPHRLKTATSHSECRIS